MLNEHFKGKKNLTADRYRFLCTKPLDEAETHDAWITRLKKVGVECEWENMTLKEAIKLAVLLHTKSTKLQAEIIAQDMTYDRLVEKARAIELTKKEIENIKKGEKSFQVDSLGNTGSGPWNTQGGYRQNNEGYGNRGRSSYRRNFGHRKGRGGSNFQASQRKPAHQPPAKSDAPGLCSGCGFRVTDRHDCRAKHEICLACNDKGHYA